MPRERSHWTEKSTDDFVFSIGADYIWQVENELEACNFSQKQFAKLLSATEGYVSQILNNPGNLGLKTIVKLARVLGKKVSIVLYDDEDPQNEHGPIHSEIFRMCWERSGKPADFFELHDDQPMLTASTIAVGENEDINRIGKGIYHYNFLLETPGVQSYRPEIIPDGRRELEQTAANEACGGIIDERTYCYFI